MDDVIQSASNKELAKTHVDFLGAWLEKTHKLSHKGVHADLQRVEAVKAVFHTYLVVADILMYLKKNATTSEKPNINRASLDELEALLSITRTVAKEVIKIRVRDGALTPDSLKSISGIGPKTLELAKATFSFEKP